MVLSLDPQLNWLWVLLGGRKAMEVSVPATRALRDGWAGLECSAVEVADHVARSGRTAADALGERMGRQFQAQVIRLPAVVGLARAQASVLDGLAMNVEYNECEMTVKKRNAPSIIAAAGMDGAAAYRTGEDPASVEPGAEVTTSHSQVADVTAAGRYGVVPCELAAVAAVDADRVDERDQAWRTSNEPLYRSDHRSPEQIFESAFAPLDRFNYDLMTRVVSGSVYVSFTRDPELHFQPLSGNVYKDRFRYEIDAPGGIVINDTMFAHSALYEHEQEVVFAGGVRARFFMGAQEVRSDGSLGRYFLNLGFHPEVEPAPLRENRVRIAEVADGESE